jgi:hypothetical protein
MMSLSLTHVRRKEQPVSNMVEAMFRGLFERDPDPSGAVAWRRTIEES